MKVAILGAGVVGVTSAYYLARAGHEVVVLDRQPGAALETSFANAGEISPGYSAPWAGPGVPVKAVKWILMKYGPLAVRPNLDPRMWIWIARMLRNCTAARYAVNKERMVRLAEYSRDMLEALRSEIDIAYDGRTRGTLQLFRKQSQLDGTVSDIDVLKELGVAYELLDREGCVAAEPGLRATAEKFLGGLRLPGDETGDCFLFTTRLAEHAVKLGVTFQYNTAIQSIEPAAKGVIVHTSAGDHAADACIVALGSHSPHLLRPLGISIPVYPVKGYSITVPIVDEPAAPVSTIMDESYKIAITRLGERIRVGGTAELSGFDLRLRPSRRAALEHSLTDLFPSAGDVGRATFWTGLRPMTPDGPPIIGPTRIPGLYLNTGHGTLGWTMACGSGRLIADMVSGVRPNIAWDDLSIARYA
jgi:D-amino-acid dehydrogenase